MGSIVTKIKSKELYLYNKRKDCSLPEEGWLQRCYNCEQVTSHNVFLCNLYEKKLTNVCYVYLCKKCSRLYYNDKIINRKYLINDLVKLNKLSPERIDYKPVEP